MPRHKKPGGGSEWVHNQLQRTLNVQEQEIVMSQIGKHNTTEWNEGRISDIKRNIKNMQRMNDKWQSGKYEEKIN